jgi:hypothetical protein
VDGKTIIHNCEGVPLGTPPCCSLYKRIYYRVKKILTSPVHHRLLLPLSETDTLKALYSQVINDFV